MLPGKDREESAMCRIEGKAKLKSKSKSKFEDGSLKEVNERNNEVRQGRAKQHNRLGSLLIYTDRLNDHWASKVGRRKLDTGEAIDAPVEGGRGNFFKSS